jgi:methylmalonyl-CoA/ethylmalonyl-CoA epimerase
MERGNRMIKGIGHIGLAVSNLEEALKAIMKTLDIPVPPILEKTEWKTRAAVVQVGETGIEILEDYGGEGMIGQFVKEKGNGIHHICVITDNIEEDIETLKRRGVEMMDDKPRIGVRGKKIAFTKPSALGGIPLELSEP